MSYEGPFSSFEDAFDYTGSIYQIQQDIANYNVQVLQLQNQITMINNIDGYPDLKAIQIHKLNKQINILNLVTLNQQAAISMMSSFMNMSDEAKQIIYEYSTYISAPYNEIRAKFIGNQFYLLENSNVTTLVIDNTNTFNQKSYLANSIYQTLEYTNIIDYDYLLLVCSLSPNSTVIIPSQTILIPIAPPDAFPMITITPTVTLSPTPIEMNDTPTIEAPPWSP